MTLRWASHEVGLGQEIQWLVVREYWIADLRVGEGVRFEVAATCR